MSHKNEDRQKFLNGYSAKELLKKYSLTESGTWAIHGEDPNCDLGGSHHQPYLTDAKGTLSDVIDYAVSLGGFWQWGAGGTITKREAPVVVDVTNNKLRDTLKQRQQTLEKQLADIKDELYNLGERK